MLVYCLAYSPTLKMVAKFYFEISVHFQRNYIPEDRNVHIHRCESPKSYILERVTVVLEDSKTRATCSASHRLQRSEYNSLLYVLLCVCSLFSIRKLKELHQYCNLSLILDPYVSQLHPVSRPAPC
jgi:hypothetical protein